MRASGMAPYQTVCGRNQAPDHSSDRELNEISLVGESWEESVSQSTLNKHPENKNEYVPKKRHHKTRYLVVAFYATAWTIAALHFWFLSIIDGKELGSFFSLRQSQVSTVSLLLVTAFRAAIVATLGLCFTQYLWYFLRRECLRVGIIEDLFQIRSNVWRLVSPKVVRHAPVLSLVAALSWIVPLATIYPPTALTIESELQTNFLEVNASIMNPLLKAGTDIDPRYTNWETNGGFGSLAMYFTRYDEDPESDLAVKVNTIPVPGLRSLAGLVTRSGRIIPPDSLAGENSSYSLQFEGPRFRCSESRATEYTTIPDGTMGRLAGIFNTTAFNGSWPTLLLNWCDQATFNLTQVRHLGYFSNTPEPIEMTDSGPQLVGNATLTLVSEHQTMRCNAYTTSYKVRISYTKGIAHVDYTTSETEEPLGNQPLDFRDRESEKSEQILLDWKHKANSIAILDAIGYHLNFQWELLWVRPPLYKDYGMRQGPMHRLPNSTEIRLGTVIERPEDNFRKEEFVRDTVLNHDRFETNQSHRFDPRNSLNVTEASINELLANLSISALSLNTWYGNVNVTDRQFRNVYRFSQSLNFFLPYGLCLGFTAIFIVLGLNALRINGISATDGGFLQIMMTTTGDTAMSREVKGASLGGSGNASKNLLEMKVRLGELISEGEETAYGHYGFGTVEETVPIKRKG